MVSWRYRIGTWCRGAVGLGAWSRGGGGLGHGVVAVEDWGMESGRCRIGGMESRRWRIGVVCEYGAQRHMCPAGDEPSEERARAAMHALAVLAKLASICTVFLFKKKRRLSYVMTIYTNHY